MPNNEQTSSLLKRYQRLIKIAGDLTSKLDLDILLLEIVKAAADITDAEEASILLYDSIKEELYFQAATNLDTTMCGMIVPLHNSIAGWIIRSREPIIIDNPQEDDRHFEHVDKVTQLTSRSLLGVPLITKEKMIGVLEAINKKEGTFTLEDQEV
ncbi:MAG: GAF domain-containing protein, partial [Chloroflexota bacterium]|nr:GAF domain-containing protein [Chloroflexota bacterium]